MDRAARGTGSVVLDRRRSTWNFLERADGKRRSQLIGTLDQYPTKQDARAAWEAKQAADREAIQSVAEEAHERSAGMLGYLVEGYREDRMPTRSDTRRSYEVWLRNHILPKWGQSHITDLTARAVELWLRSLPLAPKSKVHIRGVIRNLWDYAIWRGDIPNQPNPMQNVRIKGASKRTKRTKSLTVDEFQRFAHHLDEPFRTIAILCVCLGLRISECLGLKWCDVDWLQNTLRIERGIVAQKVDDTKTDESRRALPVHNSLVNQLQVWRQNTQFASQADWMFASPVQLGRLPWSYDQIWRVYQKAAVKAGIGRIGTHAMRHTYRSWLDAVGTSLAVQQKLMRHADIRTTMNVYGDVVTDEVRQAQGKVTGLAFPIPEQIGSLTDRKVS